MLRRIFRPRVLLYTAILWGIIFAAGAGLYLRVPLKVDVIRDRAAIAREVEGGQIENVYRLQVMNTTESPRDYEIRVDGAAALQGLRLATEPRVSLGITESRVFPVRVRVLPGAPAGTHRIEFHVRALDDDAVEVREKSVFIVR